MQSGNEPKRGVGKRGKDKSSRKAKARLRQRMRLALGKSIELLERDLAEALDGGEPIPRKELVQIAELFARFGVGTEDTKEVQTKNVRYVIRVPARRTRLSAVAGEQIAVVEAPRDVPALPAGDSQSHLTPGDSA